MMRWLTALVIPLVLAGCGPLAPRSGTERSEAPASSQSDVAPPPLEYASSEALLILQQNYSAQGLGWNQLDGVAENGADVEATLTAQGFNVEVVRDRTTEQLRQDISSFLNRTRNQDQLNPASFTRALIYYAGHGANSSGSGRLMGYLVPIDTPVEDRDPQGFLRLALPVDWLAEQANGSTARHTMLVLDSCFSSSIFGTRSSPRLRDFEEMEDLRRRGVFVLTASDVETPDRSPFTPAFLDAIRGAADVEIGRPRDGLVTASEIGLYVRNRVLDSAQNGGKRFGTPAFSPLSGFGDMMFGPPARQRIAPAQTESAQAVVQMADVFSRPLGENEEPRLSACSGFEHLGLPETRPDNRVPITVCYFRKDADGTRVIDALAGARIPFDAPPARLTSLRSGAAPATNMIACGQDVPGAAVRAAALALHDAGVQIRGVAQLQEGAARRRNELQILTSGQRANRPPLTREQLAAIESCPVNLSN